MTSQSSDPSRVVVERRFIYHGPELGHLPRKIESIVVSHSLKVCFQECSFPGDGHPHQSDTNPLRLLSVLYETIKVADTILAVAVRLVACHHSHFIRWL